MTSFDVQPGIYDMPDEEYFGIQALSKSFAWQMYSKTPAHAQVETVKTLAMEMGSATHCAVLEPHEFDKRYAVVPDGAPSRPTDRQRNAKKPSQDTLDAIAFWAELEASGKLILKPDDYEQCMRMRDAVHANVEARNLIQANDALVEHAAVWREGDTLCKGKADLFVPSASTLVDLKTTGDASPRGFASSVAKFGYHMQDAAYRRGWRMGSLAAGQPQHVDRFIFIAVENKAPFVTALYELDAAAQMEGYKAWMSAVELYRVCVSKQRWPAYGEGILPLSLPTWAMRETDPDGFVF